MILLWSMACGEHCGETSVCVPDTAVWPPTDPSPIDGGAITYDDAGLTLTIKEEAAAGVDGWRFGLVVTGDVPGWGGEDCLDEVPLGFEHVEDGGIAVCHPMLPDGGRLLSVALPEEVVAGETTRVTSAEEWAVTFFLSTLDDASCFVWGDDVRYYEGLGCLVV